MSNRTQKVQSKWRVVLTTGIEELEEGNQRQQQKLAVNGGMDGWTDGRNPYEIDEFTATRLYPPLLRYLVIR